MSPTDAPAAPPWVLLDAATRWPRRPDPGLRFGGAVTLAVPAGEEGRLGALRGSLREVPQDVATVVYLDASVGDAAGGLVTGLLGRLGDGDDAVAAAAPVTDALKRVDGERIVASVDRRGLYHLRAPQVLRRAALAAVLDAAAAAAPADPASLMLAAGRRVRILPVEGVGGSDDPPRWRG